MPDFNTIEEIVCDLQNGRMVVLVDERSKKVDGNETVGEGELIMLGRLTTAESVTFMMRHAGSPPAVAIGPDRLSQLGIHDGRSELGPRGASIMAAVNARELEGTGVSSQDRAQTIRKLADSQSTADDFVQPGHVIPLLAQNGGVLKRAGHTEASVDLVQIADDEQVALMAAILDNSGQVADTPYLLDFAKKHQFKVATIHDLIAHRRQTEKLVQCEAVSPMPTRHGEFTAYAYRSIVDDNPYIALVYGDITAGNETLVRMHSGCLTGDALGSLLCDCGEQLDRSIELIVEEGRGVIVYIQHHEGRGIGILHKLKAYELQQRKGLDTIEANHALGHPTDSRDYGIGAQVLYDLGLRRVRFLTNNPKKRVGLEAYGITVVEQVSIEATPNKHNVRYLETKRDKMGHITLLSAEENQKG
ncbi:MAG: GTP cyclohydrolase II [Candidatus Latescibacterota bacterium]|nr:GTP cyclohydrolase II [Candidatus Latescibacterota bacterium]